MSFKDAPQTLQCLVQIEKVASPCTFIQNKSVGKTAHVRSSMKLVGNTMILHTPRIFEQDQICRYELIKVLSFLKSHPCCLQLGNNHLRVPFYFANNPFTCERFLYSTPLTHPSVQKETTRGGLCLGNYIQITKFILKKYLHMFGRPLSK